MLLLFHYITLHAENLLLKTSRLNLNRGVVFRPLFIFIKKANDMISHMVLISNLPKWNFTANLVKWMKCPSNKGQHVPIHYKLSQMLDNKASVPHGSTFGPLLLSP